MKGFNKRILIVSYAGDLAGIKSDVNNYYTFFTSHVGGEWNNGEIRILSDTSVTEVMREILYYRLSKLDYFIFVFCGHGASRNNEVAMQINDTDPLLMESSIMGVAPRQLSIFDCCREKEYDDVETISEVRDHSLFSFGGKLYGNVRERYENRIMQSVPQSACLYACSIGESAEGNNSGGFYSYNLLKAARHITDDREFKTVGLCHTEACRLLGKKSAIQHPDYKLPRCLVNNSLIFSIHP